MNKSIVTFTRGTLAQATPLWQYDYGQVLEINGLELPTTYQVHFCNCSDTQTITVLGNADGVLIPDNLLQTGKTVIAYIYLHTGADDGETEYKITIPIRPRPAPSDIPPTPEQQSALDEAIAALNSAVEDVEDIADGIPDQINAALAEAKESGEFDGPQGPEGPQGATGPAGPAGAAGEDGYSPTVTVTDITGGHRVTITDEDGDHVFDVMDGQGGSGGTSDYDDLANQPQINGTTLSGNKTAAELGLEPEALIVNITQSGSDYTADKTYQQIREAATEGKRVIAYLNHRLFQLVSVTPSSNAAVFAVTWQGSVEYIIVDLLNAVSVQGSTIGNYSKPVSGIPASDLASAVQTSLSKADTALQSVPSTYRTAAAQDAIDDAQDAAIAAKLNKNQGTANSGKIMTVGPDGLVVPEDNRFVVTLTPTAADYSGTMDKTVAEIDAAYKAGKIVLLRVLTGTGANSYAEVACTAVVNAGQVYPSYGGYIVDIDNDILIYAWTAYTDSGTINNYHTNIYPLSIPSAQGVSF